MTFYLEERPLSLTPQQFRLLSHLYQHAGEVCTRERCAEAIWGRDYDPGMDADALDRAIANLRAQLRQVDPDSDLIQTRRGLGYVLELYSTD
jgi:DNA-binding response OmpR family regulator